MHRSGGLRKRGFTDSFKVVKQKIYHKMKALLILFSCFFCLSACKSKSRNVPLSYVDKIEKNNPVLSNKTDDTIKKTINFYQKEDTLYNIVERISEVKDLIKKLILNQQMKK